MQNLRSGQVHACNNSSQKYAAGAKGGALHNLYYVGCLYRGKPVSIEARLDIIPALWYNRSKEDKMYASYNGFKSAKIGAEYVWRTALMLYGEGVTCFPSPHPACDLITANGVKIEVKHRAAGRKWAFRGSQLDDPLAFDFAVLWSGDTAYIVSSEKIHNSLPSPLATAAPIGIILDGKECWDLIVEEDCIDIPF